ncbi:MAG: MFS transporter [Coxiella endosymbiont of Dermacentor silvarum]
MKTSVNPSTCWQPVQGEPRIALAWFMWAATALFVLFQFFLQLSSGEIVGGLMKSFSLSALGGGVLASTYYYIYVALQTPAGLLIDRFGPRRLLSLGSWVCALGCLLFGSAHLLIWAIIGRLLMGLGAAFAFIGSLNVIARWFPPKQFALMAAVAETIGMGGTLLGGFFLANFVQRMGWRYSMIGAAAIAVVIGGLVWIIVRDAPPGFILASSKKKYHRVGQDFYFLIKKSKIWLNGLYSGLMFSIITVFVALWAIPYMQLAHHLSLVMASIVCNLVFIGVGLAGPVVGWLDGRITDRRWLLLVCSLVSAGLITVIIYMPQLSLPMVMSLMMLLGIFASGYVLTFGIANEIVPSHMRGTSLGFVNALSVGAAPLLQPIIGFVLHLTAHSVTNVREYYSIHNYQEALTLIPLLILIAGILTKWMPVRGKEKPSIK